MHSVAYEYMQKLSQNIYKVHSLSNRTYWALSRFTITIHVDPATIGVRYVIHVRYYHTTTMVYYNGTLHDKYDL